MNTPKTAESSHTPGPWKASHHGDSLIVVSNSLPWITGQIGGNGSEREANARLIAAAPEILEALGAIEQALSSPGRRGDDVVYACGKALLLARAAIARAKGASPLEKQ